MDIALPMRVLALLLLTLAGQIAHRPINLLTALRSREPNQNASQQNASFKALSELGARPLPSQNSPQQIVDQSNASGTSASSPSAETQESFSQLTLFLFGSGVALFIALLAWSDQIRGINQDIRELEKRFLDSTGIEKRTFLSIVKPGSPDERGIALLEVVGGGRIKDKDSAEVLQIFTKWNKQWLRIESLSIWKYYLTIALTIALFVVGIASLITDSSQQVRIISIQTKVEFLILIPPAILVASILLIIICIAKRENSLRALLSSVSDMV